MSGLGPMQPDGLPGVDTRCIRDTNKVHRPHARPIDRMCDELDALREAESNIGIALDHARAELVEVTDRLDTAREERFIAHSALAKTRNELSNLRASLKVAPHFVCATCNTLIEATPESKPMVCRMCTEVSDGEP